MEEEKRELKTLSFKFEEMYVFLDECIDDWGNKIAKSIINRVDRFQWIIDMNTRATILKAKLQIFEGDYKRLTKK